MTRTETIPTDERPVVLLTMRAVCERLSVCRSTVYQLIGQGELSPIRIAGSARMTRFRESDIEDLIQRWSSHTTTSSAPFAGASRTSGKHTSLHKRACRTEWPRLDL